MQPTGGGLKLLQPWLNLDCPMVSCSSRGQFSKSKLPGIQSKQSYIKETNIYYFFSIWTESTNLSPNLPIIFKSLFAKVLTDLVSKFKCWFYWSMMWFYWSMVWLYWSVMWLYWSVVWTYALTNFQLRIIWSALNRVICSESGNYMFWSHGLTIQSNTCTRPSNDFFLLHSLHFLVK
jgi:hypothetical protein